MHHVGAERSRGGAASRVAVGVAHAAGPAGDGGRDGVEPDRGGRAADDEDLRAGMCGELRADGAVPVGDVVGKRAERRGVRLGGGGDQQVVGVRDGEQVGDRAAVAAAGSPNPKAAPAFARYV